MGMFIVKAGTKARAIPKGKEWYSENVREIETKKDHFFDKSELVIDPTGIAKWACTPGGVTVGSAYADGGWYGFLRDGWYLLVPANSVDYA